MHGASNGGTTNGPLSTYRWMRDHFCRFSAGANSHESSPALRVACSVLANADAPGSHSASERVSSRTPRTGRDASTPAPVATPAPATPAAAPADRHGWIGTETVKTRLGSFEFKNGYPTPGAANALLEQLTFNRAIDVYLTQMPAVAIIESRRGLRDFGAKHPNQIVIWESLMDARTLLLTANTETVYAMGFLDLKGSADGGRAPPKMLGLAMDTLQRYLVDIGIAGPDKGVGGSIYPSARLHRGGAEGLLRRQIPDVQRELRPTRFQGRRQDRRGRSAHEAAQGLPARAGRAARRPWKFLDGSGKAIGHDSLGYDHVLRDARSARRRRACRRLHAARTLLPERDRYREGKPFNPDAQQRALLSEAARTGAATARATSFASPARDTFFYPDRKVAVRRRCAVQLLERRGSSGRPPCVRLLYGTRELAGHDGEERRRGFLLPLGLPRSRGQLPRRSEDIQAPRPAQRAGQELLVRARLRLAQPLGASERPAIPSVSTYSGPKINADGSVDIYFGPELAKGQEKNWIRTVPGKGWFPIFRFYGPLQPLYDKS